MFRINNDELAERIKRHETSPDFNAGRAAILALCEGVLNSDESDATKLSQIQQAMATDLKLQVSMRKHALESGDLVSRETCLFFLRFAMGILGGVVSEHVDGDTNSRIVDAFVPRLREALRDEPRVHRLLEAK